MHPSTNECGTLDVEGALGGVDIRWLARRIEEWEDERRGQ